MELPSCDDLKAKIAKEVKDTDHVRRLENLKSSLKLASGTLMKNNKKSHEKKIRLYDRKAKVRTFEKGDLVYLYNPAMKPGLCRKFHKPWTGPYKITAKLSELNYEIVCLTDKKFVVHVNRLKRSYNEDAWRQTGKTSDRLRERKVKGEEEAGDEEEVRIKSTRIQKHACQGLEPNIDLLPTLDWPPLTTDD
jgi:hypothetical protein